MTGRPGAEDLQRSHDRYHALVRATGDIVWTNGPDGQMHGPQPDWYAYTGQSEADVQGYGWSAAVHPDDAQPTIAAWEKAVEARSTFLFEHRVRDHVGVYRWFSIHAVPVVEADGTIREWVGLHRNIEASKLAQLQLEESRARAAETERLFRTMIESMSHLGWTARADGFVDYFNPGWYEYTGTTFEQMKGWGWQAAHDPAHLPRVLKEWTEGLDNHRAIEIRFPIRRHDGVFRWFLTRVNPVLDEEGKLVRWVGISTDIDGERQTLERIERERNTLKRLFADVPAAINFLRGPDFVFEFAHPLTRKALGNREVDGKALLDVVPEMKDDPFVTHLRHVFTTGEVVRGSELLVKSEQNGVVEEAYWDFTYVPVRNAAGVIEGVMTYNVEVTDKVRERERIERDSAAIANERAIFYTLLKAAPIGLGYFDRDLRYRLVNDALVAINGVSLQAHLGHTLAEVLPMMNPEVEAGIRRALDQGNTVRTEISGRTPATGEALRTWQVGYYPVRLGDAIIGAGVTVDDVTDSKRTEQFRELFIGMLGHDLRNPLSAVTAGASLLLRRGLPDAGASVVTRIASAAERMRTMIDQMLDFTRSRLGSGIPVEPRLTNLGDVCRRVVGEFELAHLTRPIAFEERGDCTGHWDADRLAQVISNLTGNAHSYGSTGTPVRLELWDAGANVRLEVHNQGTPIAPDMMPHLFDPFRRGTESRHNKADGLGLGLFISNQIVIAHGGTLSVRSPDEAGGTTFGFELPKRQPGSGQA